MEVQQLNVNMIWVNISERFSEKYIPFAKIIYKYVAKLDLNEIHTINELISIGWHFFKMITE